MTKPKKIILGLVGEIASGKDTTAAYLAEKYRSETISFSQPLREILDILGLPQTRANMAWLGTAARKHFGQNLLAKVITAKSLGSRAKIVVLPNVRLPQDIIYLKKIPSFHLVAIEAAPKIRYRRLANRGQNADDKTKTWKQFLMDSRLATEIQIRHIAKQAEFQLDNNGTFKELHRQIEILIKKLL